jgi:hypothetical protein
MRSGPLAFGAVLVAAAPAPAAAAHVAARAEIGAEHDTNPKRLEQLGTASEPAVAASPLGRAVLSLDLAAPLGRGHLFSMSSNAAGKAFVDRDARTEDVAVAQGAAFYTWAPSPGLALGVSGAYYDVFQNGKGILLARDFRSVAPGARSEITLGPVRLSLAGGWRWFTFKPAAEYDFAGPTASLALRHAFSTGSAEEIAAGDAGADWEWSASASFEDRRFVGGRCPDEACASRLGTRTDRFWMGQLELTRTGDALLGGGVAGHVNDSNSYGETLSRLLVHARTVVLLPWQLSLSGRAELVVTQYLESVPLAFGRGSGLPLVSIEDESRSTVRLELVRPIGGSVDLGARYTYYTNAFREGPVSFHRQTFLLFFAVSFER